MSLRGRVESSLEAWARFAYRRPWRTLAVVLLLVAALGSQLPRLEVDGSADAFLLEDDPVRVAYDAYRTRFGRAEMLVVAARGPVFTQAFLTRLRELHRAIEEELPHVADVKSLVNARYTYGTRDLLVVEELLAQWPRDQRDLRRLEERVDRHPLYEGHLVSADGSVAAILVELETFASTPPPPDSGNWDAYFEQPAEPAEAGSSPRFLTGEQAARVARELEDLLGRHQHSEFDLFLTGGAIRTAVLMDMIQRDLLVFVGLSTLLIIVTLAVLFRRASGVAVPIMVVTSALLCTVATMAAAGVPITLPIQGLPSLILVIGVCDSIHVLTLFYRALDAGAPAEAALADSLGRSGLPILLTSMTTAGGLVSFASAELAPVIHFGIFGPLGVMFALVLTLVMLPPLLAIFRVRPRSPSRAAVSGGLVQRALAWCGRTAVERPGVVLLGFVAFSVGLGAGASRLYFSHDTLSWLPASLPIRQATELVDRHLGGSSSFEVRIDTGEATGLHDPEMMRRIDALRAAAANVQVGPVETGPVLSLVDVLKEIHQALNENRPEAYTVPSSRPLIAQELLLFENSGSDDLEEFMDPEARVAAMSIRLPWADGVHLGRLTRELQSRADSILEGTAEATVTGSAVIEARTFVAVILSMSRSYSLAVLLVMPLLVWMLGDVRLGLLAMAPNLVPIVVTLGLMGWSDTPLDFSTMMGGAVILGVAVDDTIHFMHAFKRAFVATGDARRSIEEALSTAGRAMLTTSIVLSGGFFIYMFAGVQNLVNLGLFTGLAIVVALAADLLLAPALIFSCRGWLTAGRLAPEDRLAGAGGMAEESRN